MQSNPNPKKTVSDFRVQDIPGYRDAIDAEQALRSEAFDGDLEYILGVAVYRLSLRKVILLRELKSPFLTRATIPTPEDCLCLLWLLSPEYAEANRRLSALEVVRPWRAKRRFKRIHRRFFQKHKKLANAIMEHQGRKFSPLVLMIDQYLELAHMDAPGSVPDGKWSPPYYSPTAATIASIADSWHWSEDAILDCPLRRLFQYYRWLVAKSGESLSNPSDVVRSKGLDKLLDEFGT